MHLETESEEIYYSMRNLFSLKHLSLGIGSTIDQNMISTILDQVSHIERLFLNGTFSYFNLDSLVNLKMLTLIGNINDSFNIELFKNLSKQLRVLKITLINIDEKRFF